MNSQRSEEVDDDIFEAMLATYNFVNEAAIGSIKFKRFPPPNADPLRVEHSQGRADLCRVILATLRGYPRVWKLLEERKNWTPEWITLEVKGG